MKQICERTLGELEGEAYVSPEGGSRVNSELRRLRHVPLKRLRIEDLRFLIGQTRGLQLLVPMALDHLEVHPLAEGDYYPGDLLASVADVGDSFWRVHPNLRRRLVKALQLALERLRKHKTMSNVGGTPLRAALERHEAVLRQTLKHGDGSDARLAALASSRADSSTRRMLVPVAWPTGKVGRGHLVPDLRAHARSSFIRLPGGRTASHGMVAFVGNSVSALDMLERWESSVGKLVGPEEALEELAGYVRWLAAQKLGGVFEAAYDSNGMLVPRKVADSVPVQKVAIPQ
jgi:hypothetical protein